MTITKLEKDKFTLQKKVDQLNAAMLDITEEVHNCRLRSTLEIILIHTVISQRNNDRKEIETLKTKNTRLEALCRVLQSERKRVSRSSFPENAETEPHNDFEEKPNITQSKAVAAD